MYLYSGEDVGAATGGLDHWAEPVPQVTPTTPQPPGGQVVHATSSTLIRSALKRLDRAKLPVATQVRKDLLSPGGTSVKCPDMRMS